MKLLTTTPPDGRRLFRVTLLASAAALLLGGLTLFALWAAVDGSVQYLSHFSPR